MASIYDVRDLLFGDNMMKQNVVLALEMAKHVDHPEAIWLTRLFSGHVVRKAEDVARVLCSLVDEESTDATALCFAWMITRKRGDLSWLERSASLGNCLAHSMLAFLSSGERCFRHAQLGGSLSLVFFFLFLVYFSS
jgi:hypothetical protein